MPERGGMQAGDAHIPSRSGPFGRSAPFRGAGSEIVRGISWLYLKTTGWHIGSDWPDVPKSVIVAAPHTSNWDGLAMLAVAGWYRVKLSWMGKASLVKGPFGWLVRRAGCVPVDRAGSHDVVEQMRAAFAHRPVMHLAVAPEGTRKANPDWKTGFYHIARSAGVPLIMSVLDYRTRIVRLDGPMALTGDMVADMARILDSYRGAEGKYPERFVLPGDQS